MRDTIVIPCQERQASPFDVGIRNSIGHLRFNGKHAVHVVLFMLLAFWSTPIEAAPLHPLVKLAFIPVFKLADLMIVTAVTLLLLKNYGLRMARVAVVFLVTTILCSVLLFTLILPAFGGNLVAGMACVILLETAVLFALVNLDWFRCNGENAVLLTRTLFLATFCGNAVSVCISIWVVGPLQLRLLQLLIHNS